MTDESMMNNVNGVYDHKLFLLFFYLLFQKDSLFFMQNKNI